MEYITFSENTDKVKYALFVKSTSSSRNALLKYYITPLEELGISKEEIIVVSISSKEKKYKSAPTKDKLQKIAQGINNFNIKYILIANGDLYKFLTGVTKTANCFGEAKKGNLPGYEDINLILSIDYNALVYNESLRFKLDNSINTFYDICTSIFKLNKDIIHSRSTPITAVQIQQTLQGLHKYDVLSCDIETESLRFEKARIVTAAFAWDKHNGIVFSVDTEEEETIKQLLYEFFKDYKGTFLFQGALFDVKVIIYQLFMEDSIDIEGLIEGLRVFKHIEDSMLVTYLATNSTQETSLGLKENVFEFAGNYGIEFDDDHSVHDYPREEVLEYNLKDALCTWYLYEKYYPKMLEDNQVNIYREIFLPSILPLLYMMLMGLPMNMKKVHAADKKLDKILFDIEKELQKIKSIQITITRLKELRFLKDFTDRYAKAKHKDRVKIKTLDQINDEEFNPNSDKQKRELLYNILNLPILNTTDGGAASCDNKTLTALVNHTNDPTIKHIIELLNDYAAASIISSTFIKNFIKYAFIREDGSVWLNGNKKLGGTQSGRLASNSPNLENLPSNSKYGKLIKECFEALPGFLFGGADFSSLEDRINAILTQDPNKIKVYKSGFDSHALRSNAYFPERMPDIQKELIEIKKSGQTYEVTLEDGTVKYYNAQYLIDMGISV